MGESPLCFLFPHLYHLFSFKNCQILNLIRSKNSVSYSFGCRSNLSDRETMEVALLSLLEAFSLREGRRDVHV